VEALRRSIALAFVEGFERVPGKGVRGRIDGKETSIGGSSLLGTSSVPSEASAAIAEEGKKGKTVVYVFHGEALVGAIALADVIREESREAIVTLKGMGIQVGEITGDSEDVAGWVAAELGIDEVFARVLPGDKAGKVKLLQDKGFKVAMVGDGINDAPALTQADLGIAIGAGTNVAIESAGIVLVKNDPRDIPKIIRLSKLTYAKMIQNLFWATGYNVVALPLAAGVLAWKGIVMQPALAALFMSLSTVIVAVNALTLRRARLSV
jgi:Cu2+-exporting ATPase